jgi:ATP-dependent RNA helicase RhlE
LTFDTLGLRPESLRAIADQGYTEPTPVQAQAIPAILAGRDVLVGAQTGTGKTAAFVLPMIQTLHAAREPGPMRARALVMVPTRELALQVEQSIRTYGAHRPVRSATILGGMPMDRQVRALRAGVEVVVATPGRLLDHVRQRTIDLGRVEILVLDEADRMLDMGFIHDIKRILEQLPTERQSLLFSATFSPQVRRLAEDLLREPLSIDAAPRNAIAAPIRQVIHPVDHSRKRELLSHMLRRRDIHQALVFTRTKRGANRLAEQLAMDGIRAAAIHGNKSQSQRVRALSAFKKGDTHVLVATDIAARGLDIESLPHVVNFELPDVPEDYVHRIGRTGRAGQPGTAISLVAVEEQDLVRAIEKLLKQPIEREVIDGFEPGFRVLAAANPVSQAGRHGDRRSEGATPRRPRAQRGRNQPDGRVTNGGHGRGAYSKGRDPGRGQSHRAGPGSTPVGHLSVRDGSASVPRGAGQHSPRQDRQMPGERLSGRRPSADRRFTRDLVGRPR